jgi:hypothetical protein
MTITGKLIRIRSAMEMVSLVFTKQRMKIMNVPNVALTIKMMKQIMSHTNQDVAIPSVEIIINKGSKQYRTYLGLVDIGTSSSQIYKEIVEFSSFTMKISYKHIKWVNQAGTFQTDGAVELENELLPYVSKESKGYSQLDYW